MGGHFTKKYHSKQDVDNDVEELGYKLNKAQAKIAKLKRSKKDLKEKFTTTKGKLAETNSMLEEVELDCSQQAQYNANLKSKLAEAEETSERLEKENEDLKSTIKGSEADLKREARKTAKLQKDISVSVRREELLKPLLDVGVSIRLRFLQQAREPIYNHRPTPEESKILKKGNEAAHRGDGLADAALFKAKFVDDDHVLAKVFRRLYRCRPTDYLDPNEVTMLSRMLDCEASIMVVRRVRDTSGSAPLRKNLLILQEKLYSSLTRSTSIIAWEENPTHKTWLANLENITAKIVKIDRRMEFRKGRVYAQKNGTADTILESETESSDLDESDGDSSSDSEESGDDIE
ncbi:hypothetical protein N431DRAFT_450690 [Stipitochalara longipes BDJ]|nr:hypothetical protein N431DRAFT_450690 [Stipitochalara longipes BDJ]